ncbi:MAG TPA: glycogen debranching protein GlgX [Mycobacteriales bacterium]|nr:glycogen debranching protein GlgX [Mycobacteriales bacterium]
MTEIWPGSFVPVPLGAHPQDGGTTFAVSSDVATAVTLCLFDENGAEERLAMPAYDAGVWRGFVPGVGPGRRYGYRVTGPYDPGSGARCNPAKLLLDPYARAIDGDVRWDPSLLGDDPGDSAGAAPRSLVVDTAFDWGDDAAPRTPYGRSVIYETHVKGITARHPDVPEDQRGTYAGLAHPAVIEHLNTLGVTAVELLPVHHSLTNGILADAGKVNYWGYDTIGYFAPHAPYSAAVRAGRAGGQVAEFQSMVKALHAAGLEVILDVVFNHTAEGNERGPTLCFRGLDNAGYYRLVPGDRAHYFDTTGTGNSLDTGQPDCLRLVLDSLRFWVTEYRVDGFRFDLAPTLARQDGTFTRLSDFFDAMHQDPVVSQIKLIAEPWDVNQPDSYDVGRFPPGWTEWNGRYRDTVRSFWRSDEGTLADLGTRVTGSPDLYGPARNRPSASVNILTTHDGFTLRDLVSYDHKHNDDNVPDPGGADDNRSWSCGAEGPTDDPEVNALRARQSRALLATLFLSRGVPMLLGGDEMGRTQGGNNNAYCQDNEVSWYDWSAVDTELLDFTRRLIAFRKAHAVLRRRRYLTPDDMRWYTPAGTSMTDEDWAWSRTVVAHVDGGVTPDVDERGRPELDDDLLVAVNGWWEEVEVTVPAIGRPAHWMLEFDTYGASPVGTTVAGETFPLRPRSLVVLRAPR